MTGRRPPRTLLNHVDAFVAHRPEGPLRGSIRVRADGVTVTPPPPGVVIDTDLPPGFDPDARGCDTMPTDDHPTEDAPTYGTPEPSVVPLLPPGLSVEDVTALTDALREHSAALRTGLVHAAAGPTAAPTPVTVDLSTYEDAGMGPRTTEAVRDLLTPPPLRQARLAPDESLATARAAAVGAASRIVAATATHLADRSPATVGRRTVDLARVLTRYIVTGEDR